MLPHSQQKYFEVHRSRESIVTARFALASVRVKNAPITFNTHLADCPTRLLARCYARARAGRRPSEIYPCPTKC